MHVASCILMVVTAGALVPKQNDKKERNLRNNLLSGSVDALMTSMALIGLASDVFIRSVSLQQALESL